MNRFLLLKAATINRLVVFLLLLIPLCSTKPRPQQAGGLGLGLLRVPVWVCLIEGSF